MADWKHKTPEIVEVPEPAYRQPEPDVIVVERVEAGDRALAVLAEIMEMAPIRHTLGLNHTYESGCHCLRCAADSAIESAKVEMPMTEPKVEADRALETARKVITANNPYHVRNEHICFCAECEDMRAAVIQSAMNAQEREWREALKNTTQTLRLMLAAVPDYPADARKEVRFEIAEAERLLAERGEGR
jgi:hypothetical protein